MTTPAAGPVVEAMLLQTLRLKGRVPADALERLAGADGRTLQLVERELVAPGAAGVRLTAAGRQRLAELLDLERAALDRPGIARLYAQFHQPNAALKEIVTAWQVRPDGTANDHGDGNYDASVMTRLAALHADATPLLAQISASVPRLAGYPERLRYALQRCRAGDHQWFANPMLDSYHQIWFELHEELIGLLGVTRRAEAEAGRA
jgi:pyruvate,orthophosphate dikinase